MKGDAAAPTLNGHMANILGWWEPLAPTPKEQEGRRQTNKQNTHTHETRQTTNNDKYTIRQIQTKLTHQRKTTRWRRGVGGGTQKKMSQAFSLPVPFSPNF